jgi:hypothetical protein
MSKRKRKKRFLDLFGFDEKDFLLGEGTGRSGSGYSISVSYDQAGKPVVQVKTHGDIDVAELRKDIEQRYPGARIEGLEKKPLIRVVDEEEEKENSD